MGRKSIENDIDYLEKHKKNCRFNTLKLVCDKWFGEFGDPKGKGGHLFYTTPWEGDPMINIQPDTHNKKDAKKYQVR